MSNDAGDYAIVELLSTGHKIWLKKRITWDDQKRINAPLYKGMVVKIDPVNNQPEAVTADADVYEKMQEQEVLVLIHKIEDKNGNVINSSVATLGTFDLEDYNHLVEEVKKIYEEIKKKSKATQTISVTQ